MRILISALALALVPAAALASSALDGTWKTRTDSMKVTGKPDMFAIVDGTYTCSSCSPEVKIKADGADQAVTGHDNYDSKAVKVVDPKTVEVTNKLAGKVVATNTVTVSADGSTLAGKFTDYTGTKPATGSYTEKRVAAAAPGAHAISGSWQQDKMSDANDALAIVTYEMTPDHFVMHWNGQSYDAKFDGKEYPVTGDPAHTVVTLKRIDDRTVLETDHRMGKVTDEIRIAAAKDGKTVEVTDKDPVHGQTTTYTLEKQKQ
jgi:hypothetical protein